MTDSEHEILRHKAFGILTKKNPSIQTQYHLIFLLIVHYFHAFWFQKISKHMLELMLIWWNNRLKLGGIYNGADGQLRNFLRSLWNLKKIWHIQYRWLNNVLFGFLSDQVNSAFTCSHHKTIGSRICTDR